MGGVRETGSGRNIRGGQVAGNPGKKAVGGVRETGSERNIRGGQVAGSPEKMGAGGVREEGIGRNMESEKRKEGGGKKNRAGTGIKRYGRWEV